MAVGQLSHARDGFVDGLVDLEVLPLQIGAALPAVVEPDEEDPAVVRRAFADQEGVAHDAAGLVNQGRSCPPDHTSHAVALIEDESSRGEDHTRGRDTHRQRWP